MKTIKYISILLILVPWTGFSQTVMKIGDFDKIVVSPHINLVLIKGNDSSVKIESDNIDDNKIIVETENDILNIYLKGARFHNKYEKYERYEKNSRNQWKEDIYKRAEVTAYVTYDYLKSIQIRGEQTVRAESPINQHEFKIVLYGEVNVKLKDVNVDQLKLVMYGENELTIEKGKADKEVIKCYGENILNLDQLNSEDIKSTLYGENRLRLSADGEIKISAFGESDIRFKGNAYINKGLIIGETDIRRLAE